MRGTLVIKNISGASYQIEELGGVDLPDGETLDLTDPGMPSYYNNWWAANELVSTDNPAKLRADIVDGKIEVVSSTPPTGEVT